MIRLLIIGWSNDSDIGLDNTARSNKIAPGRVPECLVWNEVRPSPTTFTRKNRETWNSFGEVLPMLLVFDGKTHFNNPSRLTTKLGRAIHAQVTRRGN